MLINFELEEKYRGLPKGCWRCEYLMECRRPKEENWKCYNGCRKIKERERNNKTKQKSAFVEIIKLSRTRNCPKGQFFVNNGGKLLYHHKIDKKF